MYTEMQGTSYNQNLYNEYVWGQVGKDGRLNTRESPKAFVIFYF